MNNLDVAEIKDKIILELTKVIRKQGAMSDLLCIVCSYGDTLSDQEVLEQLQEWNRINPVRRVAA